MYSSEDYHSRIHNKIVKLVGNWSSYNCFIIGDKSYGDSIADEKDYISVMSENGTYSGHL